MRHAMSSFALLSLIALGAVSDARAAEAAGQPAEGAPAEEQPAAAEPMPRAGGMTGLFADALDQESLRPEQRAVIAPLLARVAAENAAVIEANRQLMLALAAGLEQGAMQDLELAERARQLAAELEAMRAGGLAALQELHGALDAGQRQQVAGAIDGRIAAAAEGPQLAPWVDAFGLRFGLIEAQLEQLRALVESQRQQRAAEVDAARMALGAMAAAFREQMFDAGAFAGANLAAERMIADMIDVCRALQGMMSPPQQQALAGSIRGEAPPAGPGAPAQPAAPAEPAGAASPGGEPVGSAAQPIAHGAYDAWPYSSSYPGSVYDYGYVSPHLAPYACPPGYVAVPRVDRYGHGGYYADPYYGRPGYGGYDVDYYGRGRFDVDYDRGYGRDIDIYCAPAGYSGWGWSW